MGAINWGTGFNYAYSVFIPHKNRRWSRIFGFRNISFLDQATDWAIADFNSVTSILFFSFRKCTSDDEFM